MEKNNSFSRRTYAYMMMRAPLFLKDNGKQMNVSGKLLREVFGRRWFLSALGDADGFVMSGWQVYNLRREASAGKLKIRGRELRLQGSKGSFGDSLDDFLFCYTPILPEQENFEISAVFTVREVSSSVSWQTGYGIFVADTVSCSNRNRRYRNHLGIGRFRTHSTVKQSTGMRVVSGYRAADASEIVGNRILDLSRDADFPAQAPGISEGERYRFLLKKTDEGFSGSISFQGETKTFSFPGCDFLMRQDPHRLYVGFAVAGTLTVDVSEICFLCSPGKSSVTPNDAIRMALPDYPFSREILPEPTVNCKSFPHPDLFVSADGKADGDGSRSDPLDLQTALNAAREGQTIWLTDGIYRPKTPYYVPKRSVGDDTHKIALRAEHTGKAVLDGSDLSEKAPLFILRGNAWHLQDLIFCGSPSSGLMICGSRNRIDHCEAYQNQDTGILICTYPGTGRAEWPEGNHVVCCDSHHNRDNAGENADGFGAKLSIGGGNVFFECTAHHNVDDGFDLFSKNVLGPIGSVTIENCVSYENGRQGNDGKKRILGGMGFKLGGDYLAIPHEVKNCIAFLNCQAGFSTNNNPCARMEDLTAWRNGSPPILHNYQMMTQRTDILPDWQMSGLLPENCACLNAAGRVTLPAAMQGPTGKLAAEADAQLTQELEKLFVSTDTSTQITRDENDLIDLHGLLTLKTETAIADRAAGPLPGVPGAKLDAEHLKERIRRKKQLLL